MLWGPSGLPWNGLTKKGLGALMSGTIGISRVLSHDPADHAAAT